MSDAQTILNTLLTGIGGSDKVDPIMLEVLQGIVNELDRVATIVDPPPVSSSRLPSIVGVAPLPVTDIAYQFTPDNIILSWLAPSPDNLFYEIRKGNVWGTASYVATTSSLIFYLDPQLEGDHTYLIKTLSQGVYSGDVGSVTFTIDPIGVISVLPQVVANAITLTWTVPQTIFRIEYYRILKDGSEIAQTSGTFYARSEQVAGTYVYSVIGVDLAGNESPQADVSVVTTGIVDYIFFASLTSSLNGTSVNAKKNNNRLVLPVNLTETYRQHFDTRGWLSPQAQVNAGYSRWLSPFVINASYEEIFDFGAIISNVIVSLSWLTEVIEGQFLFSIDIRTSTDGITYSLPSSTQSFFVPSLRYVKVKLSFTGQDDKSLMALYNLMVSLNVKRENDGGFATALGSDTVGTVVRFNKTFVDVEGITVTPVSNTSTFSTFEFVDAPFPTSFTVKVFDNAGVRITRDIRWNARGII
jgi:hypothetical protein